MENISKALMIAAGILIAIMLISLLVIFIRQMAGIYTEKHNSQMVEQITEFNKQFENYNGKTIRGNELMSVMNKVTNYNNIAHDMEGYDRVEMEVNLKGYQNSIYFKHEKNDVAIFKSPLTTDNIAEVTDVITRLSTESGFTDMQLQKLSSEISNIAEESKQSSEDLEYYKEKRMKLLKSILRLSEIDDNMISDIVEVTKKYHQYTQFKRAMFHCTGVGYNTENGRVNQITFIIDDENGMPKFD